MFAVTFICGNLFSRGPLETKSPRGTQSTNNFNNKILNGTLTKPCLFWNDWFWGAQSRKPIDKPLWTDPTLLLS